MSDQTSTFPTAKCPRCGEESFVVNACGCLPGRLVLRTILDILDRGPKGREQWHFYEDDVTGETAANDDRLDFCIDVAQRYRTLSNDYMDEEADMNYHGRYMELRKK